jgi:hypothetical protein
VLWAHNIFNVYIFIEIAELLVTVCLCCLLVLRTFQHSFFTHPVGNRSDTEQLWCWRIDVSLYGGEWKGNQARRIFNRAGSKMGKPQPSTHDMSQLTSPSRLSHAAWEDSKTSSVSWYSIESSSWDMLHFEVFLQTRTRHGFFTTRKSVQEDKMHWRAHHFRRTHIGKEGHRNWCFWNLLENVKSRDNTTGN